MNEIAPDVWHIPLTPRDGINAYLVGDVLVDTGIKGSAGKLVKLLAGRQIKAIALTHAHGDHAGAMKNLAERFGVPVWCGTAEREATETGHFVVSSTVSRLRLEGVANAAAGFAPMPVARTLTEGDSLSAGFTVLDTPGHSPGHVSFWRESDGTLICGDVFFNLHPLTLSAALRQPFDLFTPNPAQNRASERKLAWLGPSTVGFGHGPVLSKGAAGKLSAFVAELPPE